ncbi:hypothetical protein [Thalassobius sp. I31.1]|uniref:hypothetical protein n=1 Tax=Thalassobius sp. I31.1 TaxID=2109912 RepID=UPI000D1B6FD1|nr:hypothetical protein [Thalassobius sp. I31.1]
MARCVLHIGWHKTGTTSIQQNAFKNRDKLEKLGIHYPSWHQNHGAALVSAFRNDEGYYFAETFVPPPAKHVCTAHSVWGQQVFDKAIAEADGRTLLLSGEDLTLLHQSEIDALATELQSGFETVDVVAYVRNHHDYLHSTVQQLVRMGFSVPKVLEMAKAAPADLDNLRVMNPIPEYGSRLQSWVSAFGANNVHIHNYDLLRGSGQDVVKHFFGTHFDASVKSIFSENSKNTSNTSFSASAIYALNSLHQDIPLMREGKPNAKFLFNAQRFYSQLTGPAFLAGKQFEEHCNNGRDRDRDVLEKLLSRESLDRMSRPASLVRLPTNAITGRCSGYTCKCC